LIKTLFSYCDTDKIVTIVPHKKSGSDLYAMSTRHLAFAAALLCFSSVANADPVAAPATPLVTTPPATAPAPGTASPAAPQAAPVAKPATDEQSYSYITGYSDGCATANLRYARQAHVKPNKDPNLYDSDTDYHSGWDHGYRKCEDKVVPGGLSVPGNSVVM